MKPIDRYKGALVGVHVGDSLGAPYEKMFSAKQIAEDIQAREGLCMFDYRNPWPKDDNGDYLPAGRPTDDSDQTADLAHSLIACNELNPEHLRGALRNSVMHGKSRLWDGQATGAGGTTKRALSDNPEDVKEGLANTIGTNGSLMRCAPMALWFGLQDGAASVPLTVTQKQSIAQMSIVTHAHTHAIAACQIYTGILSQALAGERTELVSLKRDLDEGRLPLDRVSPVFARVLSRLCDGQDYPYDPGAWPARGTAEFSLYVALYAFLKSSSFAAGIEIAIRVGGDTDTYAAIAGGLLGAYYGYDAISQEWKDTILGHDVMVDYAQKLYDMRIGK